jgi:hypothetical protein
MSTFREISETAASASSGVESFSLANIVSSEPAEEPFTFVSRKKHGRKHGAVQLPPQTLIALKRTEETSQSNLPGSSTRKLGKPKKNSQRAKIMGQRGMEQQERTIEWGLTMIEDRVMTLKHSKFYRAFHGTEKSSFNMGRQRA